VTMPARRLAISISRRSPAAINGQAAYPGRGAADGGELRQAPGVATRASAL
jgi:hypothetical protein